MSVYCKCCGMCCMLIPVMNDGNTLVRDGFQILEDDFSSAFVPMSTEAAQEINEEYVKKVQSIFPDIKFCSCKYLGEDNKCSLGSLPPICDKFPSTPLALVPDECAYTGEVFIKNEQLKRKIRMIKEEILDYETLIAMGDKDSASYKKIIENLTRFVTKYNDFGSADW